MAAWQSPKLFVGVRVPGGVPVLGYIQQLKIQFVLEKKRILCYTIFLLGVNRLGQILVFEIRCVGSIPTPPAKNNWP